MYNSEAISIDQQTVIALFEEQAERNGDKVALIEGNEQVSYETLNQKANQLANYLISQGIGKGDIVPICTRPSWLTVVSMLGVMKSGAAYAPLDVNHPESYLNGIIDEIESHCIISDGSVAGFGLESQTLITLGKSGSQPFDASSKDRPVVEIEPEQLAYIIFTSGSTGKPKGVMIQHANLSYYLQQAQKQYWREEANGSGTFLVLSFSFDASVTSLFLTLTNGERLIIADADPTEIFDSRSFKLHAPYRFIKLTPSHLVLLENSMDKLPAFPTEILIVGGEALNANHVQFIKKQGLSVNVINEYGPTETTVGCTIYEFNTQADLSQYPATIPIGRPFEDTKVYVLDEDLDLLPIGVEGELYISGTGVGQGYFKQEDLTEELFVEDPFSSDGDQRLYKTGDLAKWLPDGNLLFLGRSDEQFKIRGYRIEPGEIEHVLNAMPEVQQSCVVNRTNGADAGDLSAYFIPDTKTIGELEHSLADEQIARWNELYERQYGEVDLTQIDESFDLSGWTDSFTGELLPEGDMKEWLEDILSVIHANKPGHLLEIGSGSGLIFHGLKKNVNAYYGTDFSVASIERLKNTVERNPDQFPKTTFRACPAHEVGVLADANIDTIVINSVIQYFPNERYLSAVLDNCLKTLNGKGTIILGDVRDHRLLKSFQYRLFLDKVQASVEKRDFIWGADQQLLGEEELCLSPEYFYQLKAAYPEINHVEIHWKQGVAENELTAYRYTVTLHVGTPAAETEPKWKIWDQWASRIDWHLIEALPQQYIYLKDVPNFRLTADSLLQKSLESIDFDTAGDMLNHLKSDHKPTSEVKEILKQFEELGYRSRFLVHPDPYKMDIVLYRDDLPPLIDYVPDSESTSLYNRPQFVEIGKKLQQTLANRLGEALPKYMVPTEIITLAQFPLTVNGKADRKFLTSCDTPKSADALHYVAPESETEKKLVNIWQELLEIDKIGLNDDFFQLGGHSLLATRVVAAVRKELQVELSLSDFFDHATISSLAKLVATGDENDTLPEVTLQSKQGDVPLSFAQERLWFMDSLHGSIQYYMHWVFRMKGNLRIDVLENTLREIIRRHEVMRTVFESKDGVPNQVVLPVESWNIIHHTIDGLIAQKGSLDDFINEEMTKPFDLAKDFMIKVHLIRYSEEEYVLVPILHHIAFDGWSMAIFVDELVETYQSYLYKRPSNLKFMSLQYSDYAIWQRKHLEGKVLDQKLAYWKQQLEGYAPLEIPLDFPRPSHQSFRGAAFDAIIDKDLSDQLLAFSKANGVTLYMTMLAAFKVLLHRYSNQEDIVVGTASAGRQRKEIEGLIGFFINTLVLRSQVSSEVSFKDFLQEVKQTTLDAFENQEAPFEKVVDALGVERDMSRNAIFQIQFLMQNTPMARELMLDEVQLTHESNDTVTSRFDLNFSLTEVEEGMHLDIVYCLDLFKRETIERLFVHYKNILEHIVKGQELLVGEIELIGDQEKQAIQAFNQTESDFKGDISLISLFEEQVNLSPDARALQLNDDILTYAELDKRSNQLAHFLMSKGIGKGAFVPICFERTFDMMVAILAVLKTGAAYVPIDPDYPQERITYIIDEIEAKVGLSHTSCSHRLSYTDVFSTVINVDRLQDQIEAQSEDTTGVSIAPEDLIYVIYTSGSTGKPKGVLQTHRALSNFVVHQRNTFRFSANDKILQFYSYCFDPSVEQIFMPLISGGTCVLIPDDVRRDHSLVEGYLMETGVTHLQATPGFLNNLKPDVYGGLKRVVAGGEVCAPSLVDKWIDIVDFYNKYGPTETAISATQFKVDRDLDLMNVTSVPIGGPVSNTTVSILDEQGRMMPIGVPGEMCIGGVQLANGYLKKEDLTKDKFITLEKEGEEPVHLYRTGDRSRWLADGSIEFMGRVDEQIKIRGYRVEPSEVEKAIQQAPGVAQCVVLGSTDKSGYNRLIAYVVPAETYQVEEVKQYLLSQLPEYMVPSFFIEIDHIPLTSTSKVDKNALPAVDGTELIGTVSAKPRNEVETRLLSIYEDVLEIEGIGIQDNFFDIGGHSLLATRAVSLIRKELKTNLSLNDFFMNPRIAELSSQIDLSDADKLPKITLKPRPEVIPLSYSQERLWFIDKLRGSVQYHMPWVFRLHGKVEARYMEASFLELIRRHESLRTVLREDQGRGYQKVLSGKDWKMTKTSVDSITESGATLQAYVADEINKPFDLSEDSMIRVNLIEISETEYVMLAVLHHVAFDGWSVSVLVEELKELYDSFCDKRPANLPALSLQFADYALWQRSHLEEQVMDQQLSFWKQQLEGVQLVDLPTDFPRPSVQSNRGAMYQLTLPRDFTARLNAFCKQEEVTLYQAMLAAFNVLIYKYTGQQDVCIGSPIANRTQSELENLIGFFVNALAIRNQVNSSLSFSEFLKEVKRVTLEAYQHQDVPFEKVVESLGVERSMSNSPIFQILFTMQNTPDVSLKLKDLELVSEDITTTISRFDIDLSITEWEDELLLSVGYCSDLFKEDTIRQMMDHYARLMDTLMLGKTEPIAALSPLAEDEKAHLLTEVNATNKPNEPTSLIGLFENQVGKIPDQPAIVFEGQEMSFDELNRKANQLAHYLFAQGVTTDDIIPLCYQRSADMVVAVMAIVKLGAAYLPIDPTYPDERIAFMLEDAGSPLVLTHDRCVDQLSQTGVNKNWVNTDQLAEALAALPETNPSKAPANSRFYVLYTSGSTGKPKGTIMREAALRNLCLWHEEQADSKGRNVLQFATLNFDPSFQEIFSALSFGGTLVLVSEETRKDMGSLLAYIDQQKVDHIFIPYIVLKSLCDYAHAHDRYPRNLRAIMTAGEQLILSAEIRRFMDQTGCRLLNYFGPTETHVVHGYEVQPSDFDIRPRVPIGKPINNTTQYILDPDQQLCPAGVIGELYIGGVMLAEGYLNQPTLTEERFVNNPFGEGKLYRTGDLARFLSDGNVEFIGRNDDQLKIRGNRVELGEVEAVLQSASEVRQCAVTVRETPAGAKSLVGHVVPEGTFDRTRLKEYLKQKLPDYMVPDMMLEHDYLPVTLNGKVNKHLLREAKADPTTDAPYEAPEGKLEETLAQILEHLLGVERVGRFDNYFDLGGNSITSIQVVSRMKEEGFDIRVADLFTHQTMAEISTANEARFEALPLLPAQHRFIEMETSSQPYAYAYFSIEENVSTQQVTDALQYLIQSQPALQMTFRKDEQEQWVQELGSDLPSATYLDLTGSAASNLKILHSEIVAESDKAKWLNVQLVGTPAYLSQNLLVVSTGPLMVDAHSLQLIASDLRNLLENNHRGISKGDYAKMVKSIEENSHSRELEAEDWSAFYQSGKGVRSNGVTRTFETFDFELDPPEGLQAWDELNKPYQTKIEDILLAGVSNALIAINAEEVQVIGLETEIREHMDKAVAGNMSTLRPFELTGVAELGARVKTQKSLRQARVKQGLGYEIRKHLLADPAMSHGHPWSVRVRVIQASEVLHASVTSEQLENGVFHFENYHEANESLILTCVVTNQKVRFSCHFESKHHEAESIKQMAEACLNDLHAVIAHCLDLNAKGISELTPSDFGLSSEVSAEELDEFLGGDDEDGDDIMNF
jgi:amino acid adenylation domain-containing protein